MTGPKNFRWSIFTNGVIEPAFVPKRRDIALRARAMQINGFDLSTHDHIHFGLSELIQIGRQLVEEMERQELEVSSRSLVLRGQKSERPWVDV